MLNIYKYQCRCELFTTQCVVGSSNLADIYVYLHQVEATYESAVIAISGNWDYEAGVGEREREREREREGGGEGGQHGL